MAIFLIVGKDCVGGIGEILALDQEKAICTDLQLCNELLEHIEYCPTSHESIFH